MVGTAGQALSLAISLLLAPLTLAGGPLRVHPENPRFFTDDAGEPIYLAGHQWFNDVQHNAWNSPVAVQWDRYLEFLSERKMNYLRNWVVWSVGDPEAGLPTPLMPFRRTGPGKALDGKPKFDLHQFEPAFFQRLSSQVSAAQDRGVYVSIMLFEVYGFMDRDGSYPRSLWAGNLFHGPNNINGIDTDENGDGHGLEFFFTSDADVARVQRAWVRKVIDTVNEFDNVVFEIANELEAKSWQYDMIRFIKRYEASKPKQHLVYMSPGGRDNRGDWRVLPLDALENGPADLYSVTRSWNRKYRGDPPAVSGRKPVFLDMDHCAAVDNDGDNDWNNNPTTPWKLLTRGYHQCMYDHDYWKPTPRRTAWDVTRHNIGATVEYAGRMNLVAMTPRQDLASTRYCLANPGREYLVFNPGAAQFTVEGLQAGRKYRFEWYDTANHRRASNGELPAAASVGRFKPPVANAVLHLVRTQPNGE